MSKKTKKNQWKKVDVTAVLGDARPVTWADEVEIDERELKVAIARKAALPTAPRSSRGTEDERVPNEPPYVAYITNIPFEVEEEDILEFFEDLQIETIRLPRYDQTGKPKGFGYVEFSQRQGLVSALQISDKTMKGRRIRIDVSENNDRDRGYGRSDRMGRDRMGMGLGRDREDDPERTMGDWRSMPRMEPAGEDRSRPGGRSGYGGGGFGDREREGRDREGFGAPREADNREGGWREGMGAGTSDRFSDRDRDSFRSRGFGDRDRDRDGFDRDRGSRFGDRDGYGDRPRYGDREGERAAERPRFSERDREDDKERFSRRDDAPPAEPSAPRERPRLNLQPRTRPVENPLPPPEEVKEKEREKEEEKKPAEPPAPPVPRASIFGAAKPVDTAAREREIEERLARERERAPRREEGDKSSERKPKDGSEHGDESQAKKVEPAPPPKENAWSRRPRIEPTSNNGVSSHSNEVDERAASPGSYDVSRERPRSGEREQSKEDTRPEENNHDRSSGNNKERESRDVRRTDNRSGENRTNRSISRDHQDNKDQEFSRNKDDGNNSDRYERKAGRGRESSHGLSRGSSHSRVDRGASGGGGVTNKGKQPPDRPSRRDHSNEDQRPLPKYEEKPIPNFVASNKYASLNEDGPEDD